MQIQQSYKDLSRGCLYLVPTPIGNLADMTYRAVKILKEVDYILAEDTRQTIKLLQYYDIEKPLKSFHDHSSEDRVAAICQEVGQGKRLALVSDAGMPLINDPGHPLVQALLADDLPVIALPGPNAALTGLVASGLEAASFTYWGFFPRHKSDQVRVLEAVGQAQATAIFYESPYRVKDLVKQVGQVLGPQTKMVIARELSKLYESFLRGTQTELATYLDQESLKGEIVVLIQGGHLANQVSDQVLLPYKEQVEMLMAQEGLLAKDAIKKVAKQRQVKKQDVYNAYHQIED